MTVKREGSTEFRKGQIKLTYGDWVCRVDFEHTPISMELGTGMDNAIWIASLQELIAVNALAQAAHDEIAGKAAITRLIHSGSLYEIRALHDGKMVQMYYVRRLAYLNQPEGLSEEAPKGNREAYQIEDDAWHIPSVQAMIDDYHRHNLIY